MKIGMTSSRADLDGPLAEHFGKAKWLLVVEVPDRVEIIRNEGLDGRSVAEVFAVHGCTDVIAQHMGPGAYAQIMAAGIRVWQGEAGKSARALARSLWDGRLRPLLPHDLERAHGHHGRHGTYH